MKPGEAGHWGPFRKFAFPDLPDALCRQVDPEIFYPEVGDSTAPAKKICGNCDEQLDCLKWAIDHNERFGVWGGFSPTQRTQLRNRGGPA